MQSNIPFVFFSASREQTKLDEDAREVLEIVVDEEEEGSEDETTADDEQLSEKLQEISVDETKKSEQTEVEGIDEELIQKTKVFNRSELLDYLVNNFKPVEDGRS